jgi:hypothetical protein
VKKRAFAIGVAVLALAVVAVGAATPPATAVTCALPAGNAAQQWDQIAQDAVVAKVPFQLESFIYMAYVNGAVYDAVTSIEGGYGPLVGRLEVTPGASVNAAIAAAAHDTLVHYLGPSDLLDCYLSISDNQASGAAVGAAAAQQMITARLNDGRMTPFGTTSGAVQPGAPGVWQPTPPAFAPPQTPWVAGVTPFVDTQHRQFLPPPPPSLGSALWARDYNEIKIWGRATGSPRTAEQSDVARFWTTNTVRQYNTGFRDAATQHGLNVLETTRLIAEGSVVAADVGIACMHAKFTYWFWRPVTAINPAARGTPVADDGNSRTQEEVGWTPLVVTPNHPEYPAAHGCVTSAMAEVFSDFFDTNDIDLTLTSTIASPIFGSTRHFATAADLRTEILYARLWGGLHYRNSSEEGIKLGRKVAHFDLTHAFAPTG